MSNTIKSVRTLAAALITFGSLAGRAHAATILYTQNFENPVGYVEEPITGYKDLSSVSVNTHYGNQPPGFLFTQQFTVETINIPGTALHGKAFTTGYVDSTGQGGNYSLGMLSSVQNDLLGLSFDVGTEDFLNFQLDVSRLGLDGPGGPFANAAPTFRFNLYNNPTGAANLFGDNTLLSSVDLSGANSANNQTLNWTTLLASLNASASTNGKVTLQIDLLSGGYAVMDNFIIAKSDVAGVVPEPGSLVLLSLGCAVMCASRRRKA